VDEDRKALLGGGCKPLLLIGTHLKPPALMDATNFRVIVALDVCHRGGWKVKLGHEGRNRPIP